MRILNLSLGQDVGGAQMRLLRGFRRHAPTWEYESITTSHTFYEIQRKYAPLEVKRTWWPWADVVHINSYMTNVRGFHRRGLTDKPYVVHHHGTIYRIGYAKHLQHAAAWRAVPIVSTLDLQAIAPDRTTWIPAPYSLDELASYRGEKWGDDGILRVAHAPTNRAIKSTDAVIDAVQRLRGDGVAVELDVIEGVSNVECMRRKGLADVYVDQVLLGYGCNAIEAWGMGLPVIAGVSDPATVKRRMRQSIPDTTLQLMQDTWGRMPWYEASEDTIYDALGAMTDPGIRKAYADRGMQHIKRWHDDAVVVPMMQEVYQRAVSLKR